MKLRTLKRRHSRWVRDQKRWLTHFKGRHDRIMNVVIALRKMREWRLAGNYGRDNTDTRYKVEMTIRLERKLCGKTW